MPTPSIQTLRADAQQVLNLDSISAVRSVVAATLANANAGTPLNPNLTTQQLWNEFYQIVTQPKSDIESIIANQLMKFLYAPPAPGGVGANGQVIFNDNGVLAGDAGLTYNKATDALTITGDLTVDTSTLKVDSTNNRVGVNKATPAVDLDVGGTGRFQSTGSNWMEFGVNVLTSNQATGANIRSVVSSAGNPTYSWTGDSDTGLFSDTANTLQFTTGGTERARIDSSGNLGLGVTPSAWVSSGGPTLQLGGANGAIAANAQYLNITSNAYYSSGYKYIGTGNAASYAQEAGKHVWYTAPSGTAGNAITFTQAMTLDASGNLILLSSNTPATLTTNGQLTVNATSNTNLRFSYRGSDGVTRTANLTLA